MYFVYNDSRAFLCFARAEKSNAFQLRKLLRDNSVIFVKLYSTSFLSFFLNIYKNILLSLKYILIESMFGKKIALMTFELHNNTHF